MYVFAADGNFRYPQEVNVVSIPIGERFEVLVRLDRPPADYTIRVASDVAIHSAGMPSLATSVVGAPVSSPPRRPLSTLRSIAGGLSRMEKRSSMR